MTVATTIQVRTPDLRIGDIVLNHGMRILIDKEPSVSYPLDPRPVYAWVGLVLNPDEVEADGFVPTSWLYSDATGNRRTEPRWNVQGNELAVWTVERAS